MPFEQVLQEIREKIRQENYVVTIHADEEMDDDRLSMLDVEECILNGEILERQRDRTTGESKYRIRGCSLEGEPMETLVKLGATVDILPALKERGFQRLLFGFPLSLSQLT